MCFFLIFREKAEKHRFISISEYDALRRLGISDPKDFVKKRLKSEHIVYLNSCCVGRTIQEQVESSVEEALAEGSWVDIMASFAILNYNKTFSIQTSFGVKWKVACYSVDSNIID